MLQRYSAGLILLFLFCSSSFGQLKEKADKLRLLFEKKSHIESSAIHPAKRINFSAVIDSSLYQEWYSDRWIDRESTVYTYNDDLTEEIFVFRRYRDNNWNPEVRTTWVYDNYHNLTRELVELYDNGRWTFDRQKFVTYSNGLVTEELYQDWNGQEWVNNSRYTSKYDNNNNQEELLVESWAEIWVNNTRYTMLYDGSNNNTLLLAENWISGWQNLYRTEKSFNDQNLLTQQVYSQWENSRWQQIEINSNSYDNNLRLAETKLQLWIDTNWVNELLTTFVYDSLTNKLTDAKDQRWNAAAEEWVNELHYIYKEDGTASESVVQVWSDSGWINNFRTISEDKDILSAIVSMTWDGSNWINSARSVTYYKLITSSKEPSAPASYRLEQNYPNPFNPSTTITFSLPETRQVKLTVYNMLGQEITTLVNETVPAGKHQVVFNAAGLASGIYYYRIETKDFIETKGMVHMK